MSILEKVKATSFKRLTASICLKFTEDLSVATSREFSEHLGSILVMPKDEWLDMRSVFNVHIV